MKNRLITGITPSGNVTLGNYVGAIKPMVDSQDENETFIFSADLHGITTSQLEPKTLRQNSISAIALYLAAGINPDKSTIFLQSEIQEHTELSYLFICNLTYGELSRMTQYKDKSSKFKLKNGTETIPAGLLYYPSLMAADILLYDADVVPVGKDQKQHIELTRNIAERFNNRYGETFKIPEPKISTGNGAKIMSLTDPTKKMSKSDADIKGTIFLLDNEKDVRDKFKRAVTDSENKIYYDVENKPGVSNLMEIYKIMTGKSFEEQEKEFEGKHYGNLKDSVADSVVEFLNDLQDRYNQIINSDELDAVLEKGYKKAKDIASKKLEEVKGKIGFYQRENKNVK